MSTILSAQAPVSFEFKSANMPLVALLLKTVDMGQLSRELAQRFGDTPDFFDNDPLVIDLSQLTPALTHGLLDMLDFAALTRLLRRYRLQPLAVRGGSDAQTTAALAAGLIHAQDAMVLRGASQQLGASDLQLRQRPAVEAGGSKISSEVPAVPTGAMVIDKPLRSGQQIYAQGRDLIVMAMVNPGAEVIADGHIHVYAPLRGKAIAGARGNTNARIFALAMAPELISIAGIYKTTENTLPDIVQGKAAQVRLTQGDDGSDKLVIKAMGD